MIESALSSDMVLTATVKATSDYAGIIVDHDPDAVPVPFLVPYATDAKHLASLDVPAYGFSPLQLAPGAPYLELWHGVDERVSVEALQWGLPVLYDVVRRFCG